MQSDNFICGGAQTVIEALLECVGKEDTIMMPAQSWKNLDPETGVHGDIPMEWRRIIRENWPAYDKEITPTNTMGAVAEMFRKWPGALRSDHPARSVAALGENAEYLTEYLFASGRCQSSVSGKAYVCGKQCYAGGFCCKMDRKE